MIQVVRFPDIGIGSGLTAKRFTPAPGRKWRVLSLMLYVEASAAVLTRSIRLEVVSGGTLVGKFTSPITLTAGEIAYISLVEDAPLVTTGTYRSGTFPRIGQFEDGFLEVMWDGDPADLVGQLALVVGYEP